MASRPGRLCVQPAPPPPLNCAPWTLSMEIKIVSFKMTSHLHHELRLKMREALPPSPTLFPLFLRGLWLRHKDIFICIFIRINPDPSENMKSCSMVTKLTCIWKCVGRLSAEAIFILTFSPFQSECQATVSQCFVWFLISALSAVRLEVALDKRYVLLDRRVNSCMFCVPLLRCSWTCMCRRLVLKSFGNSTVFFCLPCPAICSRHKQSRSAGR
jgi:hypothetical protein